MQLYSKKISWVSIDRYIFFIIEEFYSDLVSVAVKTYSRRNSLDPDTWYIWPTVLLTSPPHEEETIESETARKLFSNRTKILILFFSCNDNNGSLSNASLLVNVFGCNQVSNWWWCLAKYFKITYVKIESVLFELILRVNQLIIWHSFVNYRSLSAITFTR